MIAPPPGGSGTGSGAPASSQGGPLADESRGTKPPGTITEQQAAAWVRSMFEDVAPKYDFLNHVLSFNVDRLWRKRLLQAVRPILDKPGARVLDLCCGTGDVLLELQQATRNAVWGADFCHPMLVTAREKIERRNFPSVVLEGDALTLPLRDESLDLLTIAFGFRNLANYEAGLKELLPGAQKRGHVGDSGVFSSPRPFRQGLLRALFEVVIAGYRRHVFRARERRTSIYRHRSRDFHARNNSGT